MDGTGAQGGTAVFLNRDRDLKPDWVLTQRLKC